MIRHSTGDIVALEGTRVELVARTLERVSAVTLVTDSLAIAMDVSGQRDLYGELVVLEPGDYHFEATLPDGSVVTDTITREIRVVPDRAPQIELFEPASNREVRPSEVLDFSFVAGDDFGLTDVSLTWHFASQPNDLHRLPLFGEGVGRTVQGHRAF